MREAVKGPTRVKERKESIRGTGKCQATKQKDTFDGVFTWLCDLVCKHYINENITIECELESEKCG